MEECDSVVKPEHMAVYEKKDQYWGYSADWEKPIFYAKTGMASKEECEAITIPTVLALAAKAGGDKPALRVERPLEDISGRPKVNGKVEVPPALPLNEWKTWTWKGYYEDSRKFAKACIAAGLQPHDAVSIFGANSPDWALSMMGAILAGGKAAGIYPSDTGDQIKFKIDHANGAVLSLDGQAGFDKAKEQVAKLPYLKAIVSWGELSSYESLKNQKGEEVKVYSWDDFLKSGEGVADSELENRINNQKPGQSCVLVYTSGTTGNPKAVMLSHDSLLAPGYGLIKSDNLGGYGLHPEEERVVSYLPLSHVAGMLIDIVFPLVMVAKLPAWGCVYFARPYDLKAGSIVERLIAVKPTLFLGVPRIWEKMAEKLKTALSQATGFRAKLASWALSQGSHYVLSTNFDHKHPKAHKKAHKGLLYHLADKLVMSKVRAKLGLDKCKLALTGAAPIQLETQNFMAQFGLIICEAYGLSEGAAATTFSTNASHLYGCVGPAFPTIEVKLLNVDENDINKSSEVPPAKDLFQATEAEQGEICFRGRCIMNGYLANPRLGEEHVEEIKKKNAAAIDDKGFFHSGDKGAISKYGFFKITGRYKELIVTAGGENVAPVPIEDTIKGNCHIISNMVMIGDHRKFNVALVTLKLEGATGELPGEEKLVLNEFSYLKTNCTTITEAMKDEKVIKEITDKIAETNKNGEVVVSNAAKIQKFMILPRDLSIVNGDFTPTLKLKRGHVTKKFSDVIDLMYSSKDVYVPFPLERTSEFFETK